MGSTCSYTILVVDDNDIGRYTTVRALRRHGYQVIEAPSGQAALEMARQMPDLIVLDVNLPDIPGMDVCAALKSDESTRNIPVVHLSATYIDDAARARGLDGGADGYLVQPVDDGVLVSTINALLRLKATEQQLQRALAEKEAVIRELEEALSNIKTLTGLLPICMHCKQIRNDQGYWEQIDAYITTHSGAMFSHSVCPDCLKKHYKDLTG